MTELSYTALANEIAETLEHEQNIVLATHDQRGISARTMCYVNDGIQILFSTGINSGKVCQIETNPQVALAVGALQIEADAQLFGNPAKHALYVQKSGEKYPWLAGTFENVPEDEVGGMLVICHPTKARIYRFADGAPVWDVLDVSAKRAMRYTSEEYKVR